MVPLSRSGFKAVSTGAAVARHLSGACEAAHERDSDDTTALKHILLGWAVVVA